MRIIRQRIFIKEDFRDRKVNYFTIQRRLSHYYSDDENHAWTNWVWGLIRHLHQQWVIVSQPTEELRNEIVSVFAERIKFLETKNSNLFIIVSDCSRLF